MIEWSELHITDGTTQNTRFPVALEDGYFNVDEMAFEDVLTLCVQFASRLHFTNIHNEHDGHWARLFERDEAVIMANILSTNLKRQEIEFHRRIGLGVEESITWVGGFARKINGWLTGLKASPHQPGITLSRKIEELVQGKLSVQMEAFRQSLEPLMTEKKFDFTVDLADFDASWRITRTSNTGMFQRSSLSMEGNLSDVRKSLQTTCSSFFHAIAYLKMITPSYLEQSLHSQNHDPAVGLLITFVQLFKKAQERINTFSSRHRDFYYQRVLKGISQDFLPDEAYLVLKANAGIKEVVVAQGTEFSGGKDSTGKELVYVAETNVVVTDAKIQSLLTMLFERDPLISPERELHAVSRAHVKRIPGVTQNIEESRVTSWPLLGAGRHDMQQGVLQDANVGFAIASGVLLLKEGSRTIEVMLNISDPADEDPVIVLARRAYDEQPGSPKTLLAQVFYQYLLTQTTLLVDGKRETLRQTAKELVDNLSVDTMQRLVQNDQSTGLFNGFLMELIKQADSEEAFSRVFGKILSRDLLSCQGWLTPDKKDLICEKAYGLLNDISSQQIQELLHQDHASLSYRLLRHFFTIQLTLETGWLDVEDSTLLSLNEEGPGGKSGLKLLVNLGPEIAPVVPYTKEQHGPGWQTGLPLILFRLNPHSPVYPYSLFHGLIFGDILIEIKVHGMTDLLVSNNEGPLDTSKPFHLFGTLPTGNSFCRIGNYEMATKNLTSLLVNIEWGDLPGISGGFREYYRGYETAFSNEGFKADISIFQCGQWQPTKAEAPYRVRLFESEISGEKIKDSRSIPIPHVHYYKARDSTVSEEVLSYDLQSRNGFFKMQMTEPATAFGHKEYPGLLTKVLTDNAKIKHPKPIPNAPYTPLVNRVSLDYTAKSLIHQGREVSSDKTMFRETVIPLHPFGIETNFPAAQERLPFVLPQYAYDGNLFIGIASQRLQGRLTLLFHLQQDSSQQVLSEQSDIAWFYLASNCWHQFESSRLLSDTTDGFLSTGIVTIDIPDTINRDNTIMPNDVYWLRVSANKNLDAFCSCYSIQTQALKVLWSNRNNGLSHLTDHMAAGRIRQPVVALPGLGAVTQIGDSFGGALPETTRQMNRRMSERLRHKYRASTPWDYERLILEKFPEIFKVKCFPNMKTGERKFQPGHVLIVVLPVVRDGVSRHQFAPMVNAVLLKRIHTFVQRLASPFAIIDIRNPMYESIQVRCTVTLHKRAHRGLIVNRVNQAIVDFLSPWNEGGYSARFGWRISREDIESMIRELDDVELVTNFSMLHITKDEIGLFSLEDTARWHRERQGDERPITPTYPWSIAIPMKEHFIETTDVMRSIRAEVTGVNEVEIGRTFIIT